MTCWLFSALQREGKHIFTKIKSPQHAVLLRRDYLMKNWFKNPKSLYTQPGYANNSVPRRTESSISSQQWVYFLTREDTRLYWDIQVEDNHLWNAYCLVFNTLEKSLGFTDSNIIDASFCRTVKVKHFLFAPSCNSFGPFLRIFSGHYLGCDNF